MEQYLIGIDIGGTNIKMMIMDSRLREVEKRSIPTQPSKSYETISDNMIVALEEMFHRHNIQRPEVLHLAMGLPGTVDSKAGQTICLSVLHWDGFNPAVKIADHFGTSCSIENDANMNAFGEYAFGMNGKKDLVLLTLGTGVGGGVVFNGHIFSGSTGMAAELGHMVIVADGGAMCLCGRRGHLEAYCSGTALKRDALAAGEAFPNSIINRYIAESDGIYDNSMVTRGAEAGDIVCQDLMKRYIHYLAAGVTNVMNFYNPEIVVIGGGMSNAGDLLLKPLNKLCAEMVLSDQSYCPIVKASLGSEAGMYGACALAAQNVGLLQKN